MLNRAPIYGALFLGWLWSGCDGGMSAGDAGADLASPGDAATAPADGGADAAPDGAAGALTIPIQLMKAADGQNFVTVQVSVGKGPPFTAFVDTGSAGLRILDGVVGAGDWTLTGQTTPTYGYGSGTQLDGVVATATLTIGGVRSPVPVAVESVTAVGCSAAQPACPAAGKTPSTYRFAGTFPAIMGIGMRANPNSTKVGSPLPAFTTSGRLLVALGASGTGSIVLDPSDTARFTNVINLTNKGPSALGKYPSWDDTQIPFCVNAFCGVGLLDTGAPSSSLTASTAADLMNLGVPAGSSRVPAGTKLLFTINQKTSFTFTAGTPTISLGRTSTYSNLGQLPYRSLDVLYDHAAGTIAVAPNN